MFIHPCSVCSGAMVEVFQGTAPRNARTHLVRGDTVEPTLAQSPKKADVVDASGPKRGGPHEIGSSRQVIYVRGTVVKSRQSNVVGICRDYGLRCSKLCSFIQIFFAQRRRPGVETQLAVRPSDVGQQFQKCRGVNGQVVMILNGNCDSVRRRTI